MSQFWLCRKAKVKSGISEDMKQRRYCNAQDMVMFLLALSCRDDSSVAPVSRSKDLDKRFDDCHRSVVPIANCVDLREKLES